MARISKEHSLCVPQISELLPTRVYECHCGKKFKNRPPYELHLKRIHHNVCNQATYSLFKCPVKKCDYIGSRLNLLRRHYQSYHMEKNVVCHICDRKFFNNLQHKRHKCENLGNICQICSETFELCSLRNKHLTHCRKIEGSAVNLIKNSTVENLKFDCALALHASLNEVNVTKQDLEDSDTKFIEEFDQLINSIENKYVTDTSLVHELANLTVIFQKLQSED